MCIYIYIKYLNLSANKQVNTHIHFITPLPVMTADITSREYPVCYIKINKNSKSYKIHFIKLK